MGNESHLENIFTFGDDIIDKEKKDVNLVSHMSEIWDNIVVATPIENPKDSSLIKKWAQNLIKQSSPTEELRQFLYKKNSLNLDERMEAVHSFSEKQLGKENWTIGLVGMLYDTSIHSDKLLSSVIDKTLIQLKEIEGFFTISILKAFKFRIRECNKSLQKKIINHFFKKIIIDQIEKLTDKYTKEQIKTMILSIIKETNLHDLEEKYYELFNVRQINLSNQRTNYTNQNINKEIVTIQTIDNNEDKIFLSANKTVSSEDEINLIEHFLFKSEFLRNFITQKEVTNTALIYSYIDISIKTKNTLNAVIVDFTEDKWIQNNKNIQVAANDKVNKIKTFHDEISKAVKKNAKHVFIFVPDANFFTSYYFACNASQSMEHLVSVIDTKTCGLGFDLLLQQLTPMIISRPLNSYLSQQIQFKIDALKYWVVPKNLNQIQNQFWFKKIISNHMTDTINNEDSVPLLSMREPFELIDLLENRKILYQKILNEIDFVLTYGDNLNKKVVISYNDELSDAEKLSNIIQQKFKDISIVLRQSDLESNRLFGIHIAVALL